jgi:hypothetical protein
LIFDDEWQRYIGFMAKMKDESTKKEVEVFYEGKKGICCNFDIENNVEFIAGNDKVINDTIKELHDSPHYNPEDILIMSSMFPGAGVREMLSESSKPFSAAILLSRSESRMNLDIRYLSLNTSI